MKSISSITVLKAARIRIVNAANSGLPIFVSFSGGKDSMVLGHLVLDLVKQGKVQAKQVHVLFIDEEAIYDSVVENVKKWRTMFMVAGIKFYWLCLPFFHFNCLNSLENDESFILWDPEKKDCWVRQMPQFAITSHPMFKPGMKYQEFAEKFSDCISMVGVRVAESVQRLQNFRKSGGKKVVGKNNNYIFPIYDWTDNDVFLYIKNNNLELPEVYKQLWEVGVGRRGMRLSQFFSIDTAKSLVALNELQPGLFERVVKREPNASIILYYWDTEMFRSTKSKAEKLSIKENYKEKLSKAMREPDNIKKKEWRNVRNIILNNGVYLNEKIYKRLYLALVAGDPKCRTIKAIYADLAAIKNKKN